MLYPTKESRISFLCSLLTGKTLDWVTAVWNLNRPAFTSFERFFAALTSGFWSPWGRRWSRWTDSHIEKREKYSSGVCSGFLHTGCTNWMAWWSLKAAFSQGIEPGICKLISLVETREKTLDQLIKLAIHIDNIICSRRPSRGSTFRSLSPPVMPEQEAMQVGHARISPEERDCRYRQNLCLYCGQASHVKISCPTRPKQRASSAVSQSFNSSKCVKEPVKLAFNGGVIETIALIDSGAAEDFIDADFTKSHDQSYSTSPTSVQQLCYRTTPRHHTSQGSNLFSLTTRNKGFIVPSKSPASAGFFFVKKREGTLRLILIIDS